MILLIIPIIAWLIWGCYLVSQCDSDFGQRPVERFFATPYLVIIAPGVEIYLIMTGR